MGGQKRRNITARPDERFRGPWLEDQTNCPETGRILNKKDGKYGDFELYWQS
jgi:hypothetical protein